MDAEFIPAVCPNCGGKLQVDPSVDTMVCQYCGTEHIIRRNVTGSVTLEAFARCPLCQRNDRSEKVSAIIKNQTGQSEGVVSQQQVSTDSKGLIHTQTVNVPVKTVQTSDLARHLAPPPPPSAPQSKSGNSMILWVIIILLIIGIIGFISSIGINNSSTGVGVVFCGILPALIAVGLFFFWRSSRKKAQEQSKQQQSDIANGYQQWQQAKSRWEKLYYCGRDDIVFIPGEKTSASVADMHTYIYSDPTRKMQIPNVDSLAENSVNSSGVNTENSSDVIAVNSSDMNTVNSPVKNTFMSNLRQKIGNFWKTGKNGKLIIIVVAILIILCICCVGSISLSSILPKSTSTPTSTITYTPLPTETETLTNTPQPTVTPTDTFTPLPPTTLTAQAKIQAQTQTVQALVLTRTQIAFVSTATRQAYLGQLTATRDAYLSQQTATSEAYVSLLNCTGAGGIQTNGQYYWDFCLAKGLLVNDPVKLEIAIREFCMNKNTAQCHIGAWTDIANVPESLPMTDSQVATELAYYDKNETTGLDCFLLFKNGEQTYASSGCQ